MKKRQVCKILKNIAGADGIQENIISYSKLKKRIKPAKLSLVVQGSRSFSIPWVLTELSHNLHMFIHSHTNRKN
jgi:hypothetical protein